MSDNEENCSCESASESGSETSSDEYTPMRVALYVDREDAAVGTLYEFGRHDTLRAYIASDETLVIRHIHPRRAPYDVARFETYLGFWVVEADVDAWLPGFMVIRISEWLYVTCYHRGVSLFQTFMADEEVEQLYYYHDDDSNVNILAQTPTCHIVLPDNVRYSRPQPIEDGTPLAAAYYRVTRTREEETVYVFDQTAADSLGTDRFECCIVRDDLPPWTSAELLDGNTKRHFERQVALTQAC